MLQISPVGSVRRRPLISHLSGSTRISFETSLFCALLGCGALSACCTALGLLLLPKATKLHITDTLRRERLCLVRHTL